MSDTSETLVESLGEPPRQKKARKYWIAQLITVTAIAVLVICMVVPEIQRSREGSRRSRCKNNLKALGLAFTMYQEKFGVFPPAYTMDANGKPLHSWRTLLLPYLDQVALYETIDLSKPWNDPANAKARGTRVLAYECPWNDPQTKTNYLAIVTPGSCLRPGASRGFRNVPDGLSNTIVVIEAPPYAMVHWMSPLDADESLVLSIGPDSKMSHSSGGHALLGNGDVRFIPSDLAPDVRRALMSAAGGEVVRDF